MIDRPRMALPRFGRTPRWARRGVRVGLAVSLPIPAASVVTLAVPGLAMAYPLVLLPLLLAGPLAVGRLRGRRALGAAMVAGIVSAVVASASLAIAFKVTGAWYWGLVSAATAPPMPPLPRVTLLSTDWLTWPQQTLVVFQPLLAVGLGAIAILARRDLGPIASRFSRLLPSSFSGRLRMSFAAVTVLTLVVGVVGFGTIEEMHLRVHRLQLRSAWQQEVGHARGLLVAELGDVVRRAEQREAPSQARFAQIQAIFDRLKSSGPWPGVSAGRDDIAQTVRLYGGQVEAAEQAFRAYQDRPGDPPRLHAALLALSSVHEAVEGDLTRMLASSDLSHHERLMVVMALAAVVAGFGLWTGERVLEAIGHPLAELGRHFQRVARGEFSQRIVERGPSEVRQLGQSVNAMTSDLSRLYAAERERRARAEEIVTRERELSAAKEFWTNTLVHDLKGPLSLIAGWAELMTIGRHGRLEQPQLEAVNQIRRAARSLDELVSDINDSFRLQTEALPIHRGPVVPWELFAGIVDTYDGLDRPCPEVRITGGVGPALADARLVRRVLHNLVGNAFKHAGRHARVVLRAEPAGGLIRFAVDDDGPGIAADEWECVFEQFVQGKGARGGSGLGLAFCKLVVEQLGGRIWVDTSPLGGTRIAFELPGARPSATELLRHQREYEELAARVA